MDFKVSVLIPVYNCAAYIRDAIESLQTQTLPPYEIIVADDGSSDGSADIAATYPGVSCLRLEHSGISATRNRAVKASVGNWIAFLDADDRWLPDKLEKQLTYLEAHPDCEIVFCRYHNFTDLPEDSLTERQRRVLSVEVNEYLAGACMKRSLFDRFGFFDLHYDYGEDTEWTARLKMCGVDMSHCVEETLYERRIHQGNITLSHDTPDRNSFFALMADAIRNSRKKGI